MNIGENIRTMRLAKMMTQADLAGDQITRNMLCQIERGAALPSVPTMCYLAQRLNVPVGYLLSEEEEGIAYRKMMTMPNVYRAFHAGDAAGCLALLNSAFGEESDDEIALMRAECEYRIAKEVFLGGRLREAASRFDSALREAARTTHDTAWLRAAAAVYFRYMQSLSPTLTSDVLDAEEIETSKSLQDDFCAYVLACEALDGGRDGEVAEYLSRYRGTLFAARVAALRDMRSGAVAEALVAFERLLDDDALDVGVLMCEIFGDMDLCCRKNDDYKRAYEFASSRMALMQRLLEEI